MKKIVTILTSIILFSCAKQETKTQFSETALAEKVIQLNGGETTLKAVFNKYKGKTVVVDVWASWCSDCLAGLPKVKELQAQTKENENLVYLFLSVDRKQNAWENAIVKRNIIGEHYFLPLGMKESIFGKNIVLDWIPRYMVIGKDGEIKLFKAIKATDSKILAAIKADR